MNDSKYILIIYHPLLHTTSKDLFPMIDKTDFFFFKLKNVLI